jgi:4-hydroxy-3-methylbut-2-enyl diphosphate reductase
VPDSLVQGVLDLLASRGYPPAEEVRTAEESLIFALPPELRRDLKSSTAS